MPKNMALYRDPRKNLVIVLEELNYFWDECELDEMVELWELGKGINYISNYFDRDPDEILLALMHLAREDRIISRKGGLFGWKNGN